MRTILVTDVERGSGIAIVRSLAQQGYSVIAASGQEHAIGFLSRYPISTFVYPPPQDNPDAFIAAIKRLVQQKNISLIIPVTDEVILPLSQARAQFESICKIAIPEPDALNVVTNKQKTIELARQFSIPVPRTHTLTTLAQAQEISAELRFPVVLKPMQSRLYTEERGYEEFTVTYVNSTQQLYEKMRFFEGRSTILLQEYHHGYGTGVELLLDEGTVICAFQHERIREVPITGGVSSLRKSVAIDSTLYQYSMQMLGSLNWTGLAMVEFKVADGQPYLMEINGRVWGSLPLAISAGMNFPSYLAKCYLDDDFEATAQPDTNYRVGVHARNFEKDLAWFFAVLRGEREHTYLQTPGRISIIPALASYLNPFYYTDIFSWDDPAPSLGHLAGIVRKSIRRAIRI